MTIIKTPVHNDFSIVPNTLSRDRLLSFEGRGLLIYMRSMPKDWQFKMDNLIKESPNCKRERLQKVIKELESAGYIERKNKRNDKGKFIGMHWIIKQERDHLKTKEVLATTSQKAVYGKNPLTTKPVTITKTEYTNSSSINNARENFEKSFQEAKEEMYHKVLTEIQIQIKNNSENIKHEVKWYIELKIQEYINRYPQNDSVADCCMYVVQAVKKRNSI